MLKNNLKNFFLGILFLLMNVFSLGEVPHSYVTENPKKEVQEVETFKQKEKAELNLIATKIKIKEIEGKLVNGKLVFDITDKKDIQEGNILVTQGTPYKPNNARVRSANPIQILEATKEDNRLEVTGENLQDVYVNVLDNKGQLAGIYKSKEKLYQSQRGNYDGVTNIEITDDYDGEWLIFRNTCNNYIAIHQEIKEVPKGMKVLKHHIGPYVYTKYLNNGHSSVDSYVDVFNYWRINGRDVKLKKVFNSQNKDYYRVEAEQQKITLSDELEIEYKYSINENLIYIKLLKYPNDKNFVISHKFIWEAIFGDTGSAWYGNEQIINFKVPETLKGNSTLTFAEYYPVNEFVQFTANPTIQNAQPLALDNSVRDVSLNTTGKGLYYLREGDKLTVDGHQVVIGAGGNIGPQKLEIGSLKYTYEVKNGKFRIALNEWGVLEPDRTINIKIDTTVEGKAGTATDHNLIIKAPRKVAGTSGVKLNQDYNLGDFVRFNGINLNAPGQASLEQPIAPGVSLTSASGQGIPFMKEGDILQINDGLTRAVKSFTIGANGNLAKQQVSLKSGDLIVYAESGKLRVSAINWVLNKPIKASISLVRGTNKIMDHNLEIQVPDAPFKVTKKGILDFGNVSSGTKRTAETDIGIEMMISDVEIVEFKLKDPNPTMENLTTGDTLAVDKIEYLVIQKDDKKYDIRLKGNLTIPEATKSGTYTGSTTVQLKLK